MDTQGRNFDFREQSIYVGIDVHRKSWRVTILLGDYVQKTINLSPPGVKPLADYLLTHYPNGDYICAYEAGFSGFWAQEGLSSLGIKTMVLHPADIPTSDKERQQKDDVRDSRKIAKSIQSGQVEGIFIPSKDQQCDRALVRRRWSLVSNRQRAMNRIKMHLHFMGKHPKGGVVEPWKWNKSFIKWLKEEALEDRVLCSMIKELEYARQIERELMRELRQLFSTEQYTSRIELLRSIPGVGFLTAILLLSEIGEMNRFKTLDQLCFYTGLVPRTDSSGEKERADHRTSRGNKRLRTALIECAWKSLQQDTEMALTYAELRKKMDGPHAIIKIARKVLNRIRRVWLTKQPYVRAENI